MEKENSVLSEDAGLIEAEDEEISRYLKMMIDKVNLPDHFVFDADVFNKNPREVFISKNPIFVFVKPRTEACGKTDGCESGCWRVIGRDKLIKYEDTKKKTGKFLGFKKILKFCEKTKPREYKRSWVMEEYRLVNKWNWKKDQVICKIRLMFETEISFLLAKHFSYGKKTAFSYYLPLKRSLPEFGVISTPKDDARSLKLIIGTDENYWPVYSYFYAHLMHNVYRVEPWTLIDHTDQMFQFFGICFFANRTDACGRTDGCYGGCWRIIDRDRLIKSPETGRILGFKRVFKFCATDIPRYGYLNFIMEEFRPAKKVKKHKVLCVVNLVSPISLNRLLRR